jgi:hypothetical protein
MLTYDIIRVIFDFSHYNTLMCTFSEGIESIVVESIRKYLVYPDERFMKNEPCKLKFCPSTLIQELIPLPSPPTPNLPLFMLAMVDESYKPDDEGLYEDLPFE